MNFTMLMLNWSICHISNSFGEMFEKMRNCALVTCSSLGSVASLEVKIEQICAFSGVNTGMSE